ncbi:WXG100 family type VII secretion target [Herpetosiphon sp. NSE202]|uniref:WXG100 family type VII secretion target n=1 Tax=Herpetosiphon sp. NSE202 TaxID=3351349 RepID=UPI00362BC21C
MSQAIIQAHYEHLAQIAQRFQTLAHTTETICQAIKQTAQPLEAGQWQGEAFNRFKAELDNEVYPAFQRLNTLFSVSQEITLKISKLFEAAEAEAATLFKWEHGPAQGSQSFQAGASNARSLEAHSDLILNFLGYNPSAKPESLWAAPFVAGAAFFGPGPVPILGKWGIIPSGYTNAGKRLWLYVGGSGPDTVFSIHQHAGWGRAPFKLKKPNLRFDYGPIKTKAGLGFLPGGGSTAVPAGPNFLHWNVEGGMGQINKPLWQSFKSAITNDHQLLTRSVNPKPNIFGSIAGGKFIRGASRGLFVVGAAFDVYNIATADDKVRETTKVAGGWVGGAAGAKGGAAVGATIGTFFCPGIGTAIGGVIGGIGGGIGGYFLGSEGSGAVYDFFK